MESSLLNPDVVVRQARSHAGMTQAALAEAVGTSQPAISMYEQGRRIPDLATLDRIARACGLTATVSLSPQPVPNRLADYHHALVHADDTFRLRMILHDFGLVWNETAPESRRELISDRPEPISPTWDAFLASYTEHLCWHDQLDPPAWVFEPDRYLSSIWMPGSALPVHQVEAIVHCPAAFEAHGILIAASELVVV